jgi:hypothetical protein
VRAIVNFFAGGIAEDLGRRDGMATGARNDRKMAGWLIGQLPECQMRTPRAQYAARVIARTEALVRRHWLEIRIVAETLLEERTVGESAVVRLLRARARVEAHRQEISSRAASGEGRRRECDLSAPAGASMADARSDLRWFAGKAH